MSNESSLQESQNFLDSVVENIPDMIFVKDARDLKFVRFNRAGEQLIGIPRNEMIGKSDYDFFPKEQADFFTAKDREVLARGTVEDIPEEPLDTKNGVRILHTKKIPILDHEGHAKYLLGISEDITEKKRAAEQALLLHQEQAANQAKSTFLAHMSHEVRTPLGAILGFAELALDSAPADSDQRTFILTVIRNGRQLLKIVDEILDLSKIESDQIKIEQIPFELPPLVEDVASLLKPQAEAKGLSLDVFNLEALPPYIVSDPTRLRQILTNVIGNSIKFTNQGKVELTAQADPVSNETVLLRFSVRDTGIGIAPKEREVLFQPFSQVNSSSARKFGGSGLGLYISKRLAQELGGDLRLERSIVGRGSTFVITVRAHLADSVPPKSGEAELIKSVSKVKLKILVVDDAVDNRVLIGKFLSLMNHEADFAEDGASGVSKALQGDYDLVLMDIQMPSMDGFEALARLREKGYRRQVVALTAHAMKGYRERCLQAGFNDYLPKPVSQISLAEILSRV